MTTLYHYLLIAILIAAPLCFFALLFIHAPYGRHYRKGWGLAINHRLAWIIMESPCVIVFLIIFLLGQQIANPISWFFCCCWLFHYIYRSYIFPFRIRSQHKMMPIIIIFSGIIFNSSNAYVNAYWLGHLSQYNVDILGSPHFLSGMLLFTAGFYIHMRADHILIHLRKPGETGYAIPQGFLYRWICCPNYFGEIVQWLGFAIATWSWPGAAFAIYTMANLLPRAYAHRQWYIQTFTDFPKSRRALIPLIF